MQITHAVAQDTNDWAEMRAALWPELTVSEHRIELAAFYLAANPRCTAFVARSEGGVAVGFAEASLRRDFVNGCESSPVLFLEGIYVREPYRSEGVAKALCETVGNWGRAAGCTEFASDAYLDDAQSHAFHRAVGFEETERVVYFRKSL